uniref:Uncharacterized protein n=1 Tax=Anguilla anguilla TaxID=7936 RepID=A0A0E9XHY9_ANGAN
MHPQVTLPPLWPSVTVKVRPSLNALFSSGTSLFVCLLSGRKASKTPPLKGAPGLGWSSP